MYNHAKYLKNIPQTTVFFIQNESSGGRFLLDETDCSDKFLRYFA